MQSNLLIYHTPILFMNQRNNAHHDSDTSTLYDYLHRRKGVRLQGKPPSNMRREPPYEVGTTTNTNDQPNMENQQQSVNENSVVGTAVMIVAYTDDELSTQNYEFSILSGNAHKIASVKAQFSC